MARKLEGPLNQDDLKSALHVFHQGNHYRLAAAEGEIPELKNTYPLLLEVEVDRDLPVRVLVLKVLT